MKKNILVIWGIILIALIVLVMAADFTPQGNINLRERYNITYVTDINPEGTPLTIGANMTILDKITFRLGEIIDNLVDGWIRITGNLNVTGNVTAEHLEGNLSWDYLDTYPVACPEGTYLTELGDSVICTSISAADHDNLTVGNLTAGQLFYGDTRGDFNETNVSRPFTSRNDISVTVCSSGCDYPTIQDAVDQIPYILRHEYDIEIGAGTYEEDVYIPPIINSQTHSTEGSCCAVDISGTATIDDVKVKSFHVTSAIGTWVLQIHHMNIYGTEPRSDESVSLSIYGSNSVLVRHLNMTNRSVNYPIMFYSSNGGAHTINFDETKNGFYVKGTSAVYLGDYYGDGKLYGSVDGVIVKAGKGTLTHIQNNQVIRGGELMSGVGVVSEYNNVTTKNTYYKMDILDGEVNITGDLISDTIHEVSKESLLFDMNFNTENTNGNNVLDGSTKNNHGVNSGATLNTTGSFNGGAYYDFDGDNDEIDLQNKIINTSKDYTISLWLYKNERADDVYFIQGQEGQNFNYVDIAIKGYTSDDKIYVLVGNGLGGYFLNDKVGITTIQEWHHILVTKNGTTYTVYVDSVRKGSLESTGTLNQGDRSNLGQTLTGGGDFNGSLDDIKIYNRRLSQAEISALYLQRVESADSYVSQKYIQVDTSGNVNITSGNLTLTQKITFALGEIIDNLVDGWITITGNLNVTGNVTTGGDSFIQLEMNTTGLTCNEANAGAIYYNNDTNKHYGCNVTAWQELY